MAKYISANRGRGILKQLNVDMKKKKKYNFGVKYLEGQVGEEDYEELVMRPDLLNIEKYIPTIQSVDENLNASEQFWINYVTSNREKDQVIARIYGKIRTYETIRGILNVLSLIIAQFEYETIYYKTYYLNDKIDKKNPPNYYDGTFIRIVVSLICIALIIFSLLTNYCYYLLKREQKKIINSTFIQSPLFITFWKEFPLDLIHPFPFVEIGFELQSLGQTITYQVTTFFYAFQFLKLYRLANFMAIHTKYCSEFGDKYCDQYGCEADTAFAMKAIQKDHPFKILTVLTLGFIVCFGILLRKFEIIGNTKDYTAYSNGIWNIAVAMTTVGYGDYYPSTHLGRLVVVIAVFTGTFLVSLTIVALTNATSLTNEETKAYTILRRIAVRDDLKSVCSKILFNYFHLIKLKKEIKNRDELIKNSIYTSLKRKIKELEIEKLYLQRELNSDNFGNNEENFLNLSQRIDEDIISINQKLSKFEDLKVKLGLHILFQKQMIANLDKTTAITDKIIIPSLYKYISKNENFDIYAAVENCKRSISTKKKTNLNGITQDKKNNMAIKAQKDNYLESLFKKFEANNQPVNDFRMNAKLKPKDNENEKYIHPFIREGDGEFVKHIGNFFEIEVVNHEGWLTSLLKKIESDYRRLAIPTSVKSLLMNMDIYKAIKLKNPVKEVLGISDREAYVYFNKKTPKTVTALSNLNAINKKIYQVMMPGLVDYESEPENNESEIYDYLEKKKTIKSHYNGEVYVRDDEDEKRLVRKGTQDSRNQKSAIEITEYNTKTRRNLNQSELDIDEKLRDNNYKTKKIIKGKLVNGEEELLDQTKIDGSRKKRRKNKDDNDNDEDERGAAKSNADDVMNMLRIGGRNKYL